HDECLESGERSVAGVDALVLTNLTSLETALDKMCSVLDRMQEKCSPQDFFNLVRPWLSGWPKAGVVYATHTVNEEPEVFAGGSGAQSSIMPCLDAFLGISHGSASKDGRASQDEAKAKFQELLRRYRTYMPVPHREYIALLEDEPNLRDHIARFEQRREYCRKRMGEHESALSNAEFFAVKFNYWDERLRQIKAKYNSVINQVLNFRRKHIGFATKFISAQARKRATTLASSGNADVGDKLLEKSTKGTGGSHFKYHLQQHITDTRMCEYSLSASAVDAEMPTPHPKQLLPGLGPLLVRNSIFATATTFTAGAMRAASPLTSPRVQTSPPGSAAPSSTVLSPSHMSNFPRRSTT
ncbi:3-dioxygenase (IDO) (Biosynthesis of nicotinic acid protein 2), partial [Durusdinium trenchii]